MKQGSVLYLSLVVLGCGLGLTSACSDDEDPSECTGSDCGGASNGGGSGIAGAKATGGSKATGGAASTAKGGATSGGATGVGGASPTVGGATGVGGATTAVGGATAAGGATTAAGGRTAAGGTTTAVAGSTSVGGTTGIAGNAGTPNNNAGTAGTAGAPPLGPNLALGAKWWGTATTGDYPHAFGDVENPTTAPNTNTPANLFDGNTGNLWVSGKVFTFDAAGASTGNPTPQVAGVEFASPQLISAVIIKGRMNGNRAHNPSDYTIETSDTGASDAWTVRATLTRAGTRPICANANPDPLTHILPTPVTAKWIRLRVTDVWYVNWDATTSTWSPAGSPANAQATELEIR